jgi:predicted flap endonuclease-1-like 5' DNA nuclease
MTERIASDLGFILIALIVSALLGFLIGHFLRKNKTENCPDCSETLNEKEQFKSKLNKAENDKQLLQAELQHAKSIIAGLNQKLANFPATETIEYQQNSTNSNPVNEVKILFDPDMAKNTFGKKIDENDLKLIEGIGPKIESILKKNGITTWEALSKTMPDTIMDFLLHDGGENYRIHDPSTWPEQARLASQNKFVELKTLQENLKGGKIV